MNQQQVEAERKRWHDVDYTGTKYHLLKMRAKLRWHLQRFGDTKRAKETRKRYRKQIAALEAQLAKLPPPDWAREAHAGASNKRSCDTQGRDT